MRYREKELQDRVLPYLPKPHSPNVVLDELIEVIVYHLYFNTPIF